MPSSKFVVESKINKSFRTDKVKGMFDVEMDSVKKEFDVNIPIESMIWNIGLIVGASGTGKTTIAKRLFEGYKLFSGYEWSNNAIVDDFPAHLTAKKITESLSKVGFSSPPDWLKPFSVLSNGQKMRAELSRLILEESEPVLYDEFTSVVDRNVAKIGSAAIQKFIRKENKQFIAISCHYDIQEWLEPDWIYDVNTHEFSRRSLRRPDIEVNIRKATSQEWVQFMEFHYLSHNHNNAAHRYIAEINGDSVAWCSVLHFPHPKVKNMKRIHRIVVKPDFQGIGLGRLFLNQIASKYKRNNMRVRIITGSPAFISSLRGDNNWAMTSSPARMHKCGNKKTYNNISAKSSANRITATFEYKEAIHIESGKTYAEMKGGKDD